MAIRVKITILKSVDVYTVYLVIITLKQCSAVGTSSWSRRYKRVDVTKESMLFLVSRPLFNLTVNWRVECRLGGVGLHRAG